MTESELQRIIDRLDISEVYKRYGLAADRRDYGRLRTCFHHDATLNHLAYQGDLNGFIEWLIPRHADIPISVHFIGNSLAEFIDSSTALVETTGYAVLHIAATGIEHKKKVLGDDVRDSDEVDLEEMVRYVDRFEKRDGIWRIAQQNLISDARRARIASKDGWTLAPFGYGTRDSDDELYRIRRKLGVRSEWSLGNNPHI